MQTTMEADGIGAFPGHPSRLLAPAMNSPIADPLSGGEMKKPWR